MPIRSRDGKALVVFLIVAGVVLLALLALWYLRHRSHPVQKVASSAVTVVTSAKTSGGRARSGLHRPSPPRDVEIEGPLATRRVIHRVIPQYPEWAEEQGIGGVLSIYLTVNQEGEVTSAMRVEQTTTNAALDQIGMDALKQWRFSPTKNAECGPTEWGRVTFRFTLENAPPKPLPATGDGCSEPPAAPKHT